jgi:hypothetical protein
MFQKLDQKHYILNGYIAGVNFGKSIWYLTGLNLGEKTLGTSHDWIWENIHPVSRELVYERNSWYLVWLGLREHSLWIHESKQNDRVTWCLVCWIRSESSYPEGSVVVQSNQNCNTTAYTPITLGWKSRFALLVELTNQSKMIELRDVWYAGFAQNHHILTTRQLETVNGVKCSPRWCMCRPSNMHQFYNK